MKRLFVPVSCFAVVLILSKISFAQPQGDALVDDPPKLSVESITADPLGPVASQVLPFGYPPYPTVGGYPAYGIPYSYPRAPRRFAARLMGPPPQPHPLPVPGAVPGPPVPPTFPPTIMGEVPPLQETLGAIPAVPPPPGQPTVFYRPTPFRNFMTLLTAPRPYIGYDPYAGYPPFPGYIPPQ